MNLILLLIALAWIVSGVLMVLRPGRMREFLMRVFPAGRVKKMAALPLLLGCVLGVGALLGGKPFWPAVIVGVIGIAKGVYLLRASPAQTEHLLDWWVYRAPQGRVRLWGLVTLALGLIVLFSPLL